MAQAASNKLQAASLTRLEGYYRMDLERINMTTITFRNDEDRRNFQITIALTALRDEVRSGLIVCDPRKGTTVKTLRRFWPGLKKTRKAAYKQLVDAGVYAHLDEKN